jgi:hypothetical protein
MVESRFLGSLEPAAGYALGHLLVNPSISQDLHLSAPFRYGQSCLVIAPSVEVLCSRPRIYLFGALRQGLFGRDATTATRHWYGGYRSGIHKAAHNAMSRTVGAGPDLVALQAS